MTVGGKWRRRGLLINAGDAGEELLLERRDLGVGRYGEVGTGESGASDSGGDFEGPGDLGKRHAFQLRLTERFEKAAGGGGQFLGGVPLLFTEEVEALVPDGGAGGLVGGLMGGLIASEVMQNTGVEVLDTLQPVKLAGPISDCARAFAKFCGDGGERAGMAELEEGEKGAKSARGLAGKAWERRRKITVAGRRRAEDWRQQLSVVSFFGFHNLDEPVG